MKKAAYLVLLAFVIITSAVLLRTAFLPDLQIREQAQLIVIDEEAAAVRLSGAIRFKTIANTDPTRVDTGEFKALHSYLEKSFPAVHRTMKREIVGGYSLLYRWKGSNPSLKPVIFMGHLDVVPVEPGTEDRWQRPPFSGVISGGFIWGRGSLDIKENVTGLLEAAEILITSGFTPQRDIYIAFGHDEEVRSDRKGASQIADMLLSRGIRCEFVLDEGGSVTEGLVSGISRQVALIGIAEKGYLTLRITARGEGGHSSMPPRVTAVGVLSRAIVNIEENQFNPVISGIMRDMFAYLAPEMPFGNRVVLANLWLFSGILKSVISKSPSTSATAHTTIAPTMLSGSVKENVLPANASALINFRIAPGDSVSSVIEHVKAAVDDDRITITPLPGAGEPSPVSPVDAPSFRTIQRTIGQVYPDDVTAPMLVPGATDSRFYTGLSDCIYRFTPAKFSAENLSSIHGTNERISVKAYADCVRFFIQIMRNVQQEGPVPPKS